MLSGAISVYPEGGPQSWRATVPAISLNSQIEK